MRSTAETSARNRWRCEDRQECLISKNQMELGGGCVFEIAWNNFLLLEAKFKWSLVFSHAI